MRTRHLPLLTAVFLFACDSKPEAEPATKVDASVDARANPGADAKAVATLDAAAAADVDVTGGLAVAAVLKPVAEVEAVLGKPIVVAAADLSLDAVAGLVATGAVTTAAELELGLNAEGAVAHRVDIDADARLDYIQVVEVRTGADFDLELRAIPSSKLDAALAVRIATINLARVDAALQVAARFDAVVKGGADIQVTRRIDAAFEGDVVVAARGGAFAAWAFQPGRVVWVSNHKARADIEVIAGGDVRFVGDAAFVLTAARLADLKAKFAVKVAAPKIGRASCRERV